MRSEKVHGVVLKRSNFGEADKIFTIFTSENGKIKALAKGIRKIKSHRAPHLELFNQVEIFVHHGQTFDLITEAKTINDYSSLKSDLKLSGYLFYVSEVLDKILPENQPHPEVYEQLVRCLLDLSSQSGANKTTYEGKIKEFIVQLLWSLGYLPHGEFPKFGITSFVEEIVEKPIKSRKFLEEI